LQSYPNVVYELAGLTTRALLYQAKRKMNKLYLVTPTFCARSMLLLLVVSTRQKPY